MFKHLTAYLSTVFPHLDPDVVARVVNLVGERGPDWLRLVDPVEVTAREVLRQLPAGKPVGDADLDARVEAAIRWVTLDFVEQTVSDVVAAESAGRRPWDERYFFELRDDVIDRLIAEGRANQLAFARSLRETVRDFTLQQM